MAGDSGVRLIMTTAGSEEQALQLAEYLVHHGLAACVNLVPRMRSIYRWKGEVWDDEEFLLLIKTTISGVSACKEALNNLHSYELPEFIVMRPEQVETHFASWIHKSVRK